MDRELQGIGWAALKAHLRLVIMDLKTGCHGSVFFSSFCLAAHVQS